MTGSIELRFSTATPDGRILDTYVDGVEGGLPLLFHNGTPSSGKLYPPFVEAASQRGLRMVGYSRPGYGNSTRNPGRSVGDVVPDVLAVLDELGADRSYTVGWSGGGPHALACAALLPARLIGAVSVGGLAPSDAEGLDWMAGMNNENVDAFAAAMTSDAALRKVAERVGSSLRQVTHDDVAASMSSATPEVDRAAINSEAATWLADVFRESVRHGFWGWYDDELAFVSQWGFAPADIDVPVAVWQGSMDRMTPPAHGEWLARHIPGVRAHLLPQHGHLSLGIGSFGQILDDLLSIAPP